MSATRVPPPKLVQNQPKFNEGKKLQDTSQIVASETTSLVSKVSTTTENLPVNQSLTYNRSNLSSSSVTPKYKDFRKRTYVCHDDDDDDDDFYPGFGYSTGASARIISLAKTTLVSLCLSLLVMSYSVYKLIKPALRTTELLAYSFGIFVSIVAISLNLISIGIVIPIKYLRSCMRYQTILLVTFVVTSLIPLLQREYTLASLFGLHLIPLILFCIISYTSERQKKLLYPDSELP